MRQVAYCLCNRCIQERRYEEYLEYLRELGINPDDDPVIRCQQLVMATYTGRGTTSGPTRTTQPSAPRVGTKNKSA